MSQSESKNHLQFQGRKPSGFLGYMIGKLMNLFHISDYRLGLLKIPAVDNLICLDIGCGGGRFVKLLASGMKNCKVYGLDHSDQMVKLSRKVNKSPIKKGLVKIIQGSVSDLPFSESQFDLITAFETIQFWPDLDNSLKDVYKKLKPSGKLLIVNRLPQAGTRWSDFVQIKTADEYKEKLQSAGFSEVSIDMESKKGWIVVLSK